MDKTAPELTAPENITLKCDERIPTPHTTLQAFLNAGGVATDNCINPLSFKLLSEEKQGRNCPCTIIRTYQLSDYSGNSSSVKQWIFIDSEVIDTISENEINIVPEEQTSSLKLKSGLADYTAVRSGNWSDPDTWGGAVPTSVDNVTIPSGVTVTVDAASVCADITIESGGVLNYSGGYTLQVYGDWTNNGTFSAGSGSVGFTGNVNASITGSTSTAFYNLNINKGTSTATILNVNSIGNVSCTNSLSIANGLLRFSSGSINLSMSSGFTIPGSAGIEINEATVTGGDYSIVNNGLFKIINGNVSLGADSGNSLQTATELSKWKGGH